MLQLQKLTEDTDIIVLSDEVYEHIVFDSNQHQSACLFNDLKQRSFITASFGKTFHNTGWKIGYTYGPEALMEEFRKVHQFNVFSVHHPSQKGIADYMQDANTYLLRLQSCGQRFLLIPGKWPESPRVLRPMGLHL